MKSIMIFLIFALHQNLHSGEIDNGYRNVFELIAKESNLSEDINFDILKLAVDSHKTEINYNTENLIIVIEPYYFSNDNKNGLLMVGATGNRTYYICRLKDGKLLYAGKIGGMTYEYYNQDGMDFFRTIYNGGVDNKSEIIYKLDDKISEVK